MLTIQDKINVLHQLSREILDGSERFGTLIPKAIARNGWFTEKSILKSLNAHANNFMSREVLEHVSGHYFLDRYVGKKRVGLVLAGNLPLVGFHDILSTFLADHISVIKLSEKDDVLIPALVKRILELEPRASDHFEFVNRLKDFDAVIATGSNSTSGYFESYFSSYPHIIRKNRNGVALLSGKESKEDIIALGKDIYDHFGLGCRNVSHVMVPESYNFDFFMGTLHDHYKEVILHHKYKNNFDFNYATWLMNKVDFLMNGSLLVKEDKAIPSSIATLHYSTYKDQGTLSKRVEDQKDQIQCIVGKKEVWKTENMSVPFFEFGEAQEPGFFDYADGIDTLQFLISL